MTNSHPEPVQKLRGQVSHGPYAVGSKSERKAVFIDTTNGRYLLRRKGGPVFADAKLKRFVGHTVECDGFFVGTTLLADRIKLVK